MDEQVGRTWMVTPFTAQIIPLEAVQLLVVAPIATLILLVTGFVIRLMFQRLPNQQKLTELAMKQIEEAGNRNIAAEDRHFAALDRMSDMLQSSINGHASRETHIVTALENIAKHQVAVGENLLQHAQVAETVASRLTLIETSMSDGHKKVVQALEDEKVEMGKFYDALLRIEGKVDSARKMRAPQTDRNTLALVLSEVQSIKEEFQAHVKAYTSPIPASVPVHVPAVATDVPAVGAINAGIDLAVPGSERTIITVINAP